MAEWKVPGDLTAGMNLLAVYVCCAPIVISGRKTHRRESVLLDFLCVVFTQEKEIRAVFFAVRFYLHAVEEAGGGKGDGDSVDLANDLVLARFLVSDAAGGGH